MKLFKNKDYRELNKKHNTLILQRDVLIEAQKKLKKENARLKKRIKELENGIGTNGTKKNS